MDMSSTVFVLGAGFTRAFLPKSPLLIDTLENFGLEDLASRFENLRYAHRIIRNAISDGRGKINIEALLTRTHSLMPYDLEHADELRLLYRRVKGALVGRIEAARNDRDLFPIVQTFASACIQHGCSCITFNYDDLFDEALASYYQFNQSISDGRALDQYAQAWTPNGGYGFYCRPIQVMLGDFDLDFGVQSMRLLKLHGSINWRTKLGTPERKPIDSVLHDSAWWIRQLGRRTFARSIHFQYLDDEPFIVPPVLTKNDLVEQPLLGLIWKQAFADLEEAEQIVFVGYSFPVTDLGARTLFSDALEERVDTKIRVVNFASDDASRRQIVESYRSMFPRIANDAFYFEGAERWVRQEFSAYSPRYKP